MGVSRSGGEPGGDASPSGMRVGAVDIGSNAIRYLIAEPVGAGGWREVESRRIPVRLGAGVFTKARAIPERTVDRAVRALGGIRQTFARAGVSAIRAVATSAVRESTNGAAFVERVRSEVGLPLEMISGSEEARLIWVAVRDRVELGRDRWFLVDLGGGSVEISLVNRDGILWSESHHLGAVRLLQALREDGGSGAGAEEILTGYVRGIRIPDPIVQGGAQGLIATGGNIEALVELGGEKPGPDGTRGIPVARLRSLLQELSAIPPADRARIFGLRADRADVIVPAAIVYLRIAERVGADRILSPGTGLREGLVVDLLDDLGDPVGHEARRDEGIRAACLLLGRRFEFDERHADQVCRLALALFDELTAVHGLGERERRILMVGALLHDIGQFVSYRRHHKHSMYLIDNSELPGLPPGDVRIAALLGRYHRRSEPKPHHPGYMELEPGEQLRVRQLSALLRIADALDREHESRVRDVQVSVRRSGVLLQVEAPGDLLLESWAVERKGASLFQATFGLPLRMETAAAVTKG